MFKFLSDLFIYCVFICLFLIYLFGSTHKQMFIYSFIYLVIYVFIVINLCLVAYLFSYYLFIAMLV